MMRRGKNYSAQPYTEERIRRLRRAASKQFWSNLGYDIAFFLLGAGAMFAFTLYSPLVWWNI